MQIHKGVVPSSKQRSIRTWLADWCNHDCNNYPPTCVGDSQRHSSVQGDGPAVLISSRRLLARACHKAREGEQGGVRTSKGARLVPAQSPHYTAYVPSSMCIRIPPTVCILVGAGHLRVLHLHGTPCNLSLDDAHADNPRLQRSVYKALEWPALAHMPALVANESTHHWMYTFSSS
jgi:hypothetical protein